MVKKILGNIKYCIVSILFFILCILEYALTHLLEGVSNSIGRLQYVLERGR